MPTYTVVWMAMSCGETTLRIELHLCVVTSDDWLTELYSITTKSISRWSLKWLGCRSKLYSLLFLDIEIAFTFAEFVYYTLVLYLIITNNLVVFLRASVSVRLRHLPFIAVNFGSWAQFDHHDIFCYINQFLKKQMNQVFCFLSLFTMWFRKTAFI